MIQVSGLSKDYRTVSGGGFLLSDIRFTLQPKAITAILGTNGSGKSTLLKIIGGELDADSGSVNVDLDNSNRDESADPLRNVLYLDQDAGRDLVLSMTIGENLELAQISSRTGTLRFPSRKLLRMQALDALSKVPLGLDKRLSQQVRSLSGGERQGLVLARALLLSPRVLLLDEFVSALARHLAVRMMAVVRDLVLQSRTYCAVVTHDIDLATRFADQIVFLHNGRLMDCFLVDGPSSRDRIVNLFSTCLKEESADERQAGIPT
jgi:putative ABC transport system ATP-binding protein